VRDTACLDVACCYGEESGPCLDGRFQSPVTDRRGLF